MYRDGAFYVSLNFMDQHTVSPNFMHQYTDAVKYTAPAKIMTQWLRPAEIMTWHSFNHEYPIPASIHDVQAFLALANFYRHYMCD